jgi:hypothetical protein
VHEEEEEEEEEGGREGGKGRSAGGRTVVSAGALPATVNDCAARDTRLTGLCERACGNIKGNT